jgi:hypothetical protein
MDAVLGYALNADDKPRPAGSLADREPIAYANQSEHRAGRRR